MKYGQLKEQRNDASSYRDGFLTKGHGKVKARKSNKWVSQGNYANNTYVVDEIKNRQLMWYGHVQGMPETRIPKRAISWKPLGRRKSGIPRSWEEGIDKIMQERNLGSVMWRDRLALENVLCYKPINLLL